MKRIYDFFGSFIIIALVLVGISGLSYNLFRVDGWLETVLGKIWDLETQYILITVPVLVGAVILLNLWRGNQVMHSKTSKFPNLLLYSLIGVGLFYVGHYVLTGTI